MREIKFRAFDGERMIYDWLNARYNPPKRIVGISLPGTWQWSANSNVHALYIMQFTGLLDKNGLIQIYEDDIISQNGEVIGNIYENKSRANDLVIQGFGTKAWCATYNEALERGCKDAE
jgi:hypothetical protein